jgi:methyltransferase (TIGR00027 family)
MMNPISNTAFYCCGIRMLDAQSPRPICNDIHAERFMDQRGLDILRRFGGELRANTSNVARHRYIDDELRSRLANDAKLRVILLGCGFDSRAFRLPGGEWIELDEPALIDHKNAKLPPQECPNSLRRIPIRFDRDNLEDALAVFADTRDTVCIIEGVTMYLTAEALEQTLRVLRRLFARHEVLADLMTRAFAQSYGRSVRELIAAMGAKLDPLNDPAAPFQRAGYRETRSESIVGLTLRYRGLGWARPILGVFIPGAMRGYTVRTFV